MINITQVIHQAYLESSQKTKQMRGILDHIKQKAKSHVDYLEAENERLRRNQKSMCAAAMGKQPINESCGGCDGCLEAQQFHAMDNMQKEINKLTTFRIRATKLIENPHLMVDGAYVKWVKEAMEKVNKDGSGEI